MGIVLSATTCTPEPINAQDSASRSVLMGGGIDIPAEGHADCIKREEERE